MNILNLFVDIQRVKNMAMGYWLINSNRSVVKRFAEKITNANQFKQYIFNDNGIFIGSCDKELPLLKNREEFEKEEAREILKRLSAQRWRRTSLFD